jgi:hypothetical protein
VQRGRAVPIQRVRIGAGRDQPVHQREVAGVLALAAKRGNPTAVGAFTWRGLRWPRIAGGGKATVNKVIVSPASAGIAGISAGSRMVRIAMTQ